MFLTIQNGRAFLLQIVTANDRFRQQNGHAEVASQCSLFRPAALGPRCGSHQNDDQGPNQHSAEAA